ncbi:FecR family protein [Pseudoalteromonas xiamenensis]|uniref:FecR domain-containing protein n=1 Tax=Pseudoalteromonas xiamenensis TaxID=882626 RepID=A0A975HM13_9GAMM|nr:FecR domain-containing protein [Pseudoalteromonas xiamenensis]QTH72624.1 FecR domain-containing protein [Pseudoalteromonas xiamenensis]
MTSPEFDKDQKRNSLENAIWNDPALLEALTKVAEKVPSEEAADIRSSVPQSGWKWFAVAAATLLLSFSSWWFSNADKLKNEVVVSKAQHFDASGPKDVNLSDGTLVNLNRHAKLQFKESGAQRMATLSEGEAYFEVKRDENRPFTVFTGNATVQVLGTAFNIDKTLVGTQVDVFHGKVSVSTQQGNKRVELTKGMRAFVTLNDIEVTAFSASQPDWQMGWLELDDVSIQDAIFQLNRYSDIPVVLTRVDPSIRVSGRFKANDVLGTTQLIAELHQLNVRKFPDSIALEPR